jgi:nitrate reductase NapAB chaperone NapD
MRPHSVQSTPAIAILALAEIKASIEAFDRGDVNVFDALDAIVVVVEARQAAMVRVARREQHERDAA